MKHTGPGASAQSLGNQVKQRRFYVDTDDYKTIVYHFRLIYTLTHRRLFTRKV